MYVYQQYAPYSNLLYDTVIFFLGDRVRRIGLCVSGQKVNDLLQKVKLENYPIGDKIVLLIGTNDILQVGCTELNFHKIVLPLSN
jgi:hypothetical protein